LVITEAGVDNYNPISRGQLFNSDHIDADIKPIPTPTTTASHSTIIINWQQFHQFLLQGTTAKTAKDRMTYA
jgi:hypothetical protein